MDFFNFHLLLAIVSAALPLLGMPPYLKAILHGTTRPNAVSYGLWSLQGIIDVAASISGGAGWPVVFTLILTLNTVIIFTLSLIGYGYHKYGRLDLVCGILAVLAIIMWHITGNPLVALGLSIFAGFLSATPTFMKTWRDPKSEYYPSWLLVAAAGLCSAASANVFDFANLAYPVSATWEAAMIAGLAYFGVRRFI